MSYSEESDFLEKEDVVQSIRNCLGGSLGSIASAKALEIGGSGGILAGLLSNHVAHIISTDVDDMNRNYAGQFPHLLQSKFERNGRPFNLANLEFLRADAQDLPFRDGWFQFIFSLNAFEYIPDPLLALAEALRVTAPGGLIYIRFDPVWTADSGSHFLARIGAPWQHLISSDGEIEAMMLANGASGDEIHSYKNHMNRLAASFYRENFPAVIQRCGGTILHHDSYAGCVDPAYLRHPNRELAASRLGCNPSDLLIRNFEFLIRRNPTTCASSLGTG